VRSSDFKVEIAKEGGNRRERRKDLGGGGGFSLSLVAGQSTGCNKSKVVFNWLDARDIGKNNHEEETVETSRNAKDRDSTLRVKRSGSED